MISSEIIHRREWFVERICIWKLENERWSWWGSLPYIVGNSIVGKEPLIGPLGEGRLDRLYFGIFKNWSLTFWSNLNTLGGVCNCGFMRITIVMTPVFFQILVQEVPLFHLIFIYLFLFKVFWFHLKNGSHGTYIRIILIIITLVYECF